VQRDRISEPYARIPDVTQATLTQFVEDTCAPGSIIYTDHWVGYNGLAAAGFAHHKTNVSASGDPAHVAMTRVHRVASLLKRWLLGTRAASASARPTSTSTSSCSGSIGASRGTSACSSTG
jgi:transposase-like protein